MAEDVGERLVLGAAGDPLLELCGDLGGQLARAVAGELPDVDPERIGDQRLGVQRGSSQPAAAIAASAFSTASATVAVDPTSL